MTVPIPIAPPNINAKVTRTTPIAIRALEMLQPVRSTMSIIDRSIGFGAMRDCKYSAVPMAVQIIPTIKQMACVLNVVGAMTGLMKNNHESIPIPVKMEVIKAIHSGAFFSASAFPIIIEPPTTTSQLPIDNPNVLYNPTSSASNGDVPSIDWTQRAIPKDKIIIPAT